MGTELDMKIVKQILDEWEKKKQEIEKGKHKEHYPPMPL